MKYHSARERVYLAVDSLASGEHGIISRLENVYISHLLQLRLDEFKGKKSIELFENIMKPINEGKLKDGILSSVTIEEGRQIAKDIVYLLVQIDKYNDEE